MGELEICSNEIEVQSRMEELLKQGFESETMRLNEIVLKDYEKSYVRMFKSKLENFKKNSNVSEVYLLINEQAPFLITFCYK